MVARATYTHTHMVTHTQLRFRGWPPVPVTCMTSVLVLALPWATMEEAEAPRLQSWWLLHCCHKPALSR